MRSGVINDAVTTTTLSSGLSAVRAEIERACREASRDPATVTLVAVSKTFDSDAIEPLLAAGQKVFGENRVQEAQKKWLPLLKSHPGVELHMIGPLQSNKAKEAVALFDAIHSVDRASLCEALAKEIGKQARPQQVPEQPASVARPGVPAGAVGRPETPVPPRGCAAALPGLAASRRNPCDRRRARPCGSWWRRASGR
jgi:hypothetical protein